MGHPAQFSPGCDGIGCSVHQELGITRAILAWQKHSPHPPSQQHPCHHLDQNHFFSSDRAYVCAEDCIHSKCPETHILVNKFCLELPWKKKVCFFTLDTSAEREGCSSWLKILTFPKRWQSIATAHFWAQHQKVRQIGKIISGWTKTFSCGGGGGRKQTMTHPPKPTYFEQSV